MRRHLLLAPALAVALLWSGGCASTATDTGCFPLDGNLVKAERTFLGTLTSGRAEGGIEARARYCLGLIYSLPGGGLYDWGKAETALEWVVEFDPSSGQGQIAALLLELHTERDRLGRELAGQQDRARFLLGEVAKIQEESDLTDVELEDRQARVEELAGEIGQLNRNIADLRSQLDTKQDELKRIRKIDLETPP